MIRFRKVSPAGWVAVFWLSGVLTGWSQLPKGQTVSGFRYPDYDPEGVLRSLVQGEEAHVLSETKVEITTLRIDIFKGTNVETRVTSPFCLFNPETRSAQSESSLRIVRENLTITGEGFSWDTEAQRFIIEKQARVVIQGLSKKNKNPIGAGP